MKTVLITGGAGYIGSHAVRELGRTDSGYHPVTIDNLSEGHREAILAGDYRVGDLADESFLDAVFSEFQFDSVMHFASRCYVDESMRDPRLYYEQNLLNALTLLRVMLRYGTTKLVLSSTCATYGEPVRVPIDESHPLNPVNPYGETKYFLERVLKHYSRAYAIRSVSLRYFNAAGASLDAQVGESHDPETHLIPIILQTAARKREKVSIFGTDYPTRDGTCIRDYIHVVDLSRAHVAALQWLDRGEPTDVFNLGTGRGYSVQEMIDTARRVTGCEIPAEVKPRRPGDPPELVADSRKANRLLGWTPQHSDLGTVMATAWKWEQNRRY